LPPCHTRRGTTLTGGLQEDISGALLLTVAVAEY